MSTGPQGQPVGGRPGGGCRRSGCQNVTPLSWPGSRGSSEVVRHPQMPAATSLQGNTGSPQPQDSCARALPAFFSPAASGSPLVYLLHSVFPATTVGSSKISAFSLSLPQRTAPLILPFLSPHLAHGLVARCTGPHLQVPGGHAHCINRKAWLTRSQSLLQNLSAALFLSETPPGYFQTGSYKAPCCLPPLQWSCAVRQDGFTLSQPISIPPGIMASRLDDPCCLQMASFL